MASITRHPQSQFWTACFRDSNGRQRRVSTKETDRKKAKRIAEEFEKAVRTKRTLRQVQTVLGKLHEEIAGESIVRKSLRQYAAIWLLQKRLNWRRVPCTPTVGEYRNYSAISVPAPTRL